jgi:hypothetical protein
MQAEAWRLFGFIANRVYLTAIFLYIPWFSTASFYDSLSSALKGNRAGKRASCLHFNFD